MPSRSIHPRPRAVASRAAAMILATALLAVHGISAAAPPHVAVRAASGVAARAAPRTVPYAVPKGSQPAKASTYPPRGPIDCAGAVEITAAPGYADTLFGTTVDAANSNAGYSCVGWNESGGEAVFRLTLPQAGQLTAVLSGLVGDLDLFLLSACDGDSCLAYANQELAARLDAGAYVLVLDGYAGASGPYSLSLAVREAGVPAAVCAGGAQRVVCAETATELQGSIYGQPDLISTYDCGTFMEQGGEAWYQLVVAGDDTVTVLADELAFDAALWLFAGCGSEAVCLGFADAKPGGGSETLTWRNLDAAQRKVYLAVDALRPAADSEAGRFRLKVTCTGAAVVPADSRSWGSLRQLYR